MKSPRRNGLLTGLLGALFALAGSANAAVIYDEQLHGDFATTTRASLTLAEGDNVILGRLCFAVASCAEGDFDWFDFFFAANQQLNAITIEYLREDPEPGSLAFLAAETASSSISYMLVSPPGPLGGSSYLALQQIGVDNEPSNTPIPMFSNILPRGDGTIGYTFGNSGMTANGTQGFALDYRITLSVGPGGAVNERIATDQTIPEAPTALLLLAGLPLLAAARRRRI